MWTVQSPEPSLKHALGVSQEILLIERVLYLPIWGKYTIIKEKQIIVSKKGRIYNEEIIFSTACVDFAIVDGCLHDDGEEDGTGDGHEVRSGKENR